MNSNNCLNFKQLKETVFLRYRDQICNTSVLQLLIFLPFFLGHICGKRGYPFCWICHQKFLSIHNARDPWILAVTNSSLIPNCNHKTYQVRLLQQGVPVSWLNFSPITTMDDDH